MLIKIKAIFMEFWKSLISLKEIKKPSDKLLRVCAKNQLRFEIFEKILKFTYQNLNGKVIFKPIFSPTSQDFCHFMHLWNIQKGGWGGHLDPGLGVLSSLGAGGCINPWSIISAIVTQENLKILLYINRPRVTIFS